MAQAAKRLELMRFSVGVDRNDPEVIERLGSLLSEQKLIRGTQSIVKKLGILHCLN